MPIYEYECNACHRRTEKRQKFSDPEITECPHCGGPIARVLSAPAFSFAGGGWYKDLYSSNKPPAAGGSGEGKSEGGESRSAGSGEPKGESKGDAGSAKKDAAPSVAAPAAAPAPAATNGSGSK